MPAPVIVVALDLSLSDIDLAPVGRLARATGWAIRLLHAAAPEPAFGGYDPKGGLYDRARRDGELEAEFAALESIASELNGNGLTATCHVVVGPTVEVIVGQAQHWDAELIVAVGAKRRISHRLILGSTTSSLLKTSPIPILVLPPGARPAGVVDGFGPTEIELGLTEALHRLAELIDREAGTMEAEPLRSAVNARLAVERDDGDDDAGTIDRLRSALHDFEAEHPSLTRAVNDVSYYLSGMGI